VFWNDYSRDEDLLVTAGLIGPQYTNGKPIVSLKGGGEATGSPYAASYWDGRLWLVNTEEPDKIIFSCDSVQCPFGVPEESFPATNYLRLPSEDGQVTGMKLIAEMLLITTLRYAYTVVGNNESNYRLVRVSTRMPGVGTYQMDDFPSDVEDQPSVIYYLGTDHNVYEWVPGMQANVISKEIADKLKTAFRFNQKDVYMASHVHCVSAWRRRFVVVSIPNISQTSFIFNVENRTWTEQYFDNAAVFGLPICATPFGFATIYGQDPPIMEIYGINTNAFSNVGPLTIRQWVRDDVTTATCADAAITTFPMTFDGKKTKKQLCVVNVHAVSTTGPVVYTCNVIVDETSSKSYSATMGNYPDPTYSIYGTPITAVDGSNAEDVVVLEASFTSDGSPPTGYRFAVSISPNSPTGSLCTIMAIDIGYRDYEDPGEVDP
jgi:hypothetical protein